MQLESGNKVGRFIVDRRLGQGGMSDVFLARDDEFKRDVVLKFPHEEIMGDIATHERFNREVKIGKLLNHPNIQHLHELAHNGSSEYLVLEYVPGDSLRHVLRERDHHHNKEDFKTAVDLGMQIGSALAYAHSHSVAHRDLKPENVIITPDRQAKVMDFGIALLQGARRVTWGPMSSQVGTPDYMSPEQIQGSRGDARTDVYALGMILYEYITGRLPYAGDNALSIMNQHVNVKPPPMHQFRHDVPVGLEEVIMKAIRRKPDDRWQSMQSFVDALWDWPTVNAIELKEERETEVDSSAASGVASALNVPLSRMALNVLIFIIVFLVLVVGASHFAHPHAR